MKSRLIATVLGCFVFCTSDAQKPDPVHFVFSATKLGDTSYELHLHATTDEGWHIYSQVQPEEAIAQPTKIVFNKNPLVTISGAAKEAGVKEKYEDKTIGIIQYQYGKVDFVQPVKLRSSAKTVITGTITYQACTNEMCLPSKTVPFTIPIDSNSRVHSSTRGQGLQAIWNLH